MIYVILGTTCSGKSKLAFKIASKFNLPIISSDAFQCYKKLNIGSAKPTFKELNTVKHHYINEFDLDYEPSIYYFQKEMRKVIDYYINEGKDIIITGGTLLYTKALLFDYDLKKENNSNKYDELDLSTLQNLLKERNIEIYNQIDNNNSRRIIRALENLDNGVEINLKSGKDTLLYPAMFFQINLDKDKTNKLIDLRVEKMFKLGLIKEVDSLLNEYPDNLKSLQAIGYKEFIEGRKNNLTTSQIKENIKVHTHQYAKRQRTFLKNQFSNVIINSANNIYKLISQDLLLKKRTNLILTPYLIKKIESYSILLSGLGGVGSIISTCLARIGFKKIYLIDKDKVETSNLNRQIMYDLKDINKNKVDVCKNKLLNISPLLQIETSITNISDISDLPDKRFDIIIDCIDFVDGKASLYLKSKKDNSIFICASGSGFHNDSTKFIYGKLKNTNDKLSKNFKNKLIELNIDLEEINNINCVYPIDSKIKTTQNNKVIPSICVATNASGLAIISLLLKILEKENY